MLKAEDASHRAWGKGRGVRAAAPDLTHDAAGASAVHAADIFGCLNASSNLVSERALPKAAAGLFGSTWNTLSLRKANGTPRAKKVAAFASFANAVHFSRPLV